MTLQLHVTISTRYTELKCQLGLANQSEKNCEKGLEEIYEDEPEAFGPVLLK